MENKLIKKPQTIYRHRRINSGCIVGLICVTTLLICCKNKSTFKETKSDGLTFQATAMPGEGSDIGTVSYSARLIPDNALMTGKGRAVKTSLWYGMDSCFYLQAGSKKIYASLTQPIANGIAGTFEYLLSFEIHRQDGDGYNLIYQDKYLNHRKYQLKLY
jgi:hypothetical protein